MEPARKDRQQPPAEPISVPRPIPCSTPEVAAAAFLLLQGRTLERIDEDSPRALRFVFSDAHPEDLEAFRKGAAVPAITFAAAEKRLFSVIRQRRAERHLLRRLTEPEVPALQKERGRGLTLSKGVLAAAALLVVVAGCAKHPAPCAPYGGVLNLDRPDCRLPAEPA